MSPAFLRDVLVMTKPRLSLLVVATTAGGVWLAPGPVAWTSALLVIFATSLLVAGAQALNAFIERDIDARMLRTRDRPLASGRLSPSFGLWFGVGAAALSL